MEAGLTSLQAFAKVFRRYYGCTPAKCRANIEMTVPASTVGTGAVESQLILAGDIMRLIAFRNFTQITDSNAVTTIRILLVQNVLAEL